MAAQYAAFFGNPDLSDAEVCFAATGAAAGGGGGGATVLASMPAHRIVLKPASERWAAELERWPPSAAARPTVTIGLQGPHELPLGRALVRALYSGTLGSGDGEDSGGGNDSNGSAVGEAAADGGAAASGGEAWLLRLMELAHCSLLQGVMQLVCARLASLAEAGSLSWDAVSWLLAAPEDLSSSREFAPLHKTLAAAVQSRLGDLEVVLGCGAALAELQSLPHGALARLLSSSALRVAGERSVVAAINAWMAARGGAQNVSKEVCEQLLRCVRLNRLPLSYAALALPQQTWVIKSEAATQVAQAVALLSLPPELSAQRELQLRSYSSLRRWRQHWLDRGGRRESAAPRLVARTPVVGEQRLRAMFLETQRRVQLGADGARAGQQQRDWHQQQKEGEPRDHRDQEPDADTTSGKRVKGSEDEEGEVRAKRHRLQQPQHCDTASLPDGESHQEQQQQHAHWQTAPQAEDGNSDAHDCTSGEEAAQVTYWCGFHWRAALRWAPTIPPAGGRGRGGVGSVSTNLQLQLTLSASHAWCRRSVALGLQGVAVAVDSYAGAPTIQLQQQHAARSDPRKRGARGTRATQLLLAAGTNTRATQSPPPPSAAGHGSSGGGGGSIGGGVEAGGFGELVFRGMVPVDVSAWVFDWEGVEGMPLALRPYMKGGLLQLSVAAESVS